MVNDVRPNITITQIILFLFVFTLFVIIGISIGDKNLKISYFLVVSLILFTLFNCYLTISYYKDLRNVGGFQGERGVPGAQGPKGDSGVCTFSEKCGIGDCEVQVINESNNYYKKKIPEMTEVCLEEPNAANCNNDDDLIKTAKDIIDLNNTRIEKCKKSKLNWEDFKEKMFPPLI
jgi:hypothetical protein